MRLDHLLSKEHCTPVLRSMVVTEPDSSRMCSTGAHGWNIDIGIENSLEISVRPSGQERIGRGHSVHARCWVLRDRAGRLRVVVTTSGLDSRSSRASNGFEYRPSFENYTVDASILERSLRASIYKMIK